MIQTFKAHFLSILAGVSSTLPNFLWYKLLPQTKVTLNLLRQSNISPAIFAWDHFNGPFNFGATPIAPLGSPTVIHNKSGTCKSWDFRVRKGFTIGPALKHYCCFQVVDSTKKSIIISDTIEVLHKYLTQPEVTPKDRIVHALNVLSCAVKDNANTVHHEQLLAISKLRNLFDNWKTTTTITPPANEPTTP